MEWDLISVSDAKVRLHELVAVASSRPILLLRRSHPQAVLVSYERWTELSRELEDAKDRLALYRSATTPPDMRISHEKLQAELGLTSDAD